jgi:PAS domain S-box-containing protein
LNARRGPPSPVLNLLHPSPDAGADASLVVEELDAQREAVARARQHHEKEAAARLDALVLEAPLMVAFFDRALRYVQINPALATLNGRAPAEHLGRTLPEMLPRVGPRIESILRQVLESGVADPERPLAGGAPAPDGVTHDWRVSAFPVRGPNGDVTGAGMILADYTRHGRTEAALHHNEQTRKRAEEALSEGEARHHSLFETMAQGVVYHDASGFIVAANPAAERILGLTLSQMQGRSPMDPRWRATREDGTEFRGEEHPAMEARRTGREVRGVVMGVYHPVADEQRWITIQAVPLLRPGEPPPAPVYALFDDITEQRRAALDLESERQRLSRTNAELGRALRLKDEFLAMMSHELRTPLHAVLGLSEALDEGAYGPLSARQRVAVARVTRSGRHLLAILSDILDLAQIGAGGAALDRAPLDVEGVCRSALQLVQGAAQAKGIRLLRSVEQGVEGLVADERRLVQILVNLLDNGVKFTPAGGTVSLEVTGDSAGEQIRFAVQDSGIGIAAADCDRLFQPFTQVDGQLSRKYGGVGLGLTLVRRLVDLHGGSVHLESTPGQGSRFVVGLPWSPGENTGPQAEPPAPALPGWLEPPRIVIADDHELTLDTYVELLAAQGCEVVGTRTGEEALAQVQATRPDVVVIDIQMPGMDGLSAIRRLRADPDRAGMPIIALTALVTPGDRERCLAAGATRYLTKPVSLRVLVATLAEVLAARRETEAG